MEFSLSTKQLTLALLNQDDYEFIQKLVNTPGWIQFIGDRNVHSKADALAYIERICNTPQLYYWVVRRHDATTPMGIISFLKRDYLDYFDLGFAFLPEFGGQGYAKEAANGVLQMLREDSRFPHILATTIPENVKSIRLLGELGFAFEKQIEVSGEALMVYGTRNTVHNSHSAIDSA